MSYENYRHQIVLRLMDKLPAKLLNDVMAEIDLLSQDYTIEKTCVDLIPYGGEPEMVKMYIASLAIENRSKGTLYDYKMHLFKFFEKVRKPYNTVQTNDVRGFLAYKAQNCCPASVDHVRTVITGFYQWLVDNEYVNRNPAKAIKPVKLPRRKLPPMKQIELEEFRNACQSDRERALVDFLFSTGCRISEASNVMLSDIDWKERSVIIRHGKGDKQRTVYFNAEAELSMRKYIEARRGCGDHLFVSGRAPYEKLTRESLGADIRRIRNRLKDKLSLKVTPHSLRRTMGTTAANRGMPVQMIQALMGHESIDTTMTYVTVEQNDVRLSHNKFLAG